MSSAYKYKFLVENLPWTVSTKVLKSYFNIFGELHSAWVEYDVKTGFSKGVGYVCYTKHLRLGDLDRTHMIHGERVEVTEVTP